MLSSRLSPVRSVIGFANLLVFAPLLKNEGQKLLEDLRISAQRAAPGEYSADNPGNALFLLKSEIEKEVRKQNWRDGKRWTTRAFWIGFAGIITASNAALFLLMFTSLGDEWVQKGWIVIVNNTGLPANAGVDRNAIEAATRNLIAVLGPIAIGLILWLITVVAERRLKAYDEAIENLRTGLEKKFDDFRDAIEKRVDKYQEYSKTDLKEFKKEVENFVEKAQISIDESTRKETSILVEREILSQKDLLDKAILSYKAELETSVKDVKQVENRMSERFGAIADTAGYAKSVRGPITSVGLMVKEAARMFKNDKHDEAVLLVRDMLEQFRTATGSLRPAGDVKEDWFNLTAILGRNDEEALALEVCLAGLEQQNGAPVFK